MGSLHHIPYSTLIQRVYQLFRPAYFLTGNRSRSHQIKLGNAIGGQLVCVVDLRYSAVSDEFKDLPFTTGTNLASKFYGLAV